MSIKNKINEKHILSILAIFATAVSAFAIYQYNVSNKYKEKVENTYQKSFTELVDYVGNINVILNKALVTNTAAKLVEFSEDLWSETALAKSALGQLPTSNTELYKTSNFITQVGDYVRYLTRKLVGGGTITTEDKEQISSLVDYSNSLNKSLKNMETDFINGDMLLSEEKTKTVFSKSRVASINESLKSVEKSFESYPTLIYDGPFSEHILNKTPEILKQKEVTKDEAKKVAEKFSNMPLSYMTDTKGNIPSYIFCDDDNKICVEVSKNGGKVVMMTNSEEIKNPQIEINEASEYAKSFLSSQDYKDMKQTGFETDGNTVDFAFAHTLGEYTIYSDLVKVKVSLHDGMICGFEANGFLCNNVVRTAPEPKYTKEEISKNVSNMAKIEKINLALIPKDYGKEVWCYEIKASSKGKIFLIYINTQTMAEEEIMMMVQDPSLSMTI